MGIETIFFLTLHQQDGNAKRNKQCRISRLSQPLKGHERAHFNIERVKKMRFDELELEDELLQGLDAMNFQETTPIQELTIPVILEGKDLIACAQTGTGKTAAYTLSLIHI